MSTVNPLDSKPGWIRLLSNLIAYQMAWLACIVGAASANPLLGVIVTGIVLALHLVISRRRWAELKLIVAVGLLGGVWEFLLMRLSGVEYLANSSPALPPMWIIALWMSFATTLNVSLRWLQPRPLLAAGLGLLFGPLAWWAGQAMGALRLTHHWSDLGLLALGWAIIMPLLMVVARQLEKEGMPAPAATHSGESS